MDWKRLFGEVAGPAIEARSDTPPPGFDPPPKIMPSPGDFDCVPFVDPQAGTFTMMVPRGWRVRGGFLHPAPGDSRPWYEVVSPDGIYVLSDPDIPRTFCHFRDQLEEQYVVQASGMYMFNLPPRADRLGEYYAKTLASRRFGEGRRRMSRQRPDVEAYMRRHPSAPAQCTADEILFEIGEGTRRHIASILSAAFFNGQYAMGMWGIWEGGPTIYIAPAGLAARAEAARSHLIGSMQWTQRLSEIFQQDEMIIASAGQSAVAAQQQWFQKQQRQHQAQVAFGDAIVQNYWSQQAANDATVQNWSQREAIQDHLAVKFDDALRGHQRLTDEVTGKKYVADGGHNYYWVDQGTGGIVGTATDAPPDNTRDYMPLKKV